MKTHRRKRAYSKDGRPQPFIIRDENGVWTCDPEDLVACGFESTGHRFSLENSGLGCVQALARELDVTMSSLQAFRTGAVGTDEEWEFFYTPDRQNGFCGSPLMGKW